MEYVNILGIRTPILDRTSILNTIEAMLAGDKFNHIVTANAEIILAAQRDEEYFYIINDSDLNIIDGSGPQMAAWLLGHRIARFAGVDLAQFILEYARSRGLKIAIMNWSGGLSSRAEIHSALIKKYPGLLLLVEDIEREWSLPHYPSLNSFKPDILLVSLGAPYQERFIHNLRDKLPTVRLAIGVGGTFDFYTGKLARAPKAMRIIGLEWLWRLKEQPWRWKRIYNAVIAFPLKVLQFRFILPFLYRPNVACLLYKKVEGKYYVLIVERTDTPGHWQLPQGGQDGLSIEKAGLKELGEELNCNDFKPIASFPNLWKYTFDKDLGKFKVNVRHYGYKGQKQSLLVAEFFGNDNEIRINYWDHAAWKWVEIDKLIESVADKRRPGYEIYLEKFRKVVSE